jgi:tetratricopeptide (TPR) repeat protein
MFFLRKGKKKIKNDEAVIKAAKISIVGAVIAAVIGAVATVTVSINNNKTNLPSSKSSTDPTVGADSHGSQNTADPPNSNNIQDSSNSINIQGSPGSNVFQGSSNNNIMINQLGSQKTVGMSNNNNIINSPGRNNISNLPYTKIMIDSSGSNNVQDSPGSVNLQNSPYSIVIIDSHGNQFTVYFSIFPRYQALQTEIAILEALPNISPIDRERLNDLRRELDNLLDEIRIMGELFSRSSSYDQRLERAREYFIKGDIAGVYEVLNRRDLDRTAEERLRHLESLEIQRENLLEGLKTSWQEYMIAAQAASMLRRNNYLSETVALYETALRISERLDLFEQIVTLESFSRFMSANGHYGRSAELSEKALETRRIFDALSRGVDGSNMFAYFNYARSLAQIGRYDEAEPIYQDVLELQRNIAQAMPALFIPHVVITLIDMANMHSDMKEFDTAEEEYSEAIDLIDRMSEKQKYESQEGFVNIINIYVSALQNRGILYRNMREYDLAERDLLSAWYIQQIYQRDFTFTLLYLANLYSDKGEIDIAIQTYNSVLDRMKQLAIEQQDYYLPHLAITEYNIGIFYFQRQQYENSEHHYIEALNIQRDLFRSNPNVYYRDIMRTLNNLKVLYEEMGRNIMLIVNEIEEIERSKSQIN